MMDRTTGRCSSPYPEMFTGFRTPRGGYNQGIDDSGDVPAKKGIAMLLEINGLKGCAVSQIIEKGSATMTQRHKHADAIIAWAEGKDVQVRHLGRKTG